MTYFGDLTPYAYLPVDDGAGALNVGWLDDKHPFARGQTPAEFVKALAAIEQTARVHQTRGSHRCELCSADSDGRYDPRYSCEIRVDGDDGTVFLAPFMIRHYVTAHGYRPPIAFIKAVESQAKARVKRSRTT